MVRIRFFSLGFTARYCLRIVFLIVLVYSFSMFYWFTHRNNDLGVTLDNEDFMNKVIKRHIGSRPILNNKDKIALPDRIIRNNTGVYTSKRPKNEKVYPCAI